MKTVLFLSFSKGEHALQIYFEKSFVLCGEI